MDVVDDFETGSMKFEIAKGYIVTARSKGRIVAMRPVTHYFHADNILNKLRRDVNYRKRFVETYGFEKSRKKK